MKPITMAQTDRIISTFDTHKAFSRSHAPAWERRENLKQKICIPTQERGNEE